MRASPTLHVVESGNPGRTVVFLPGLGGTARYWQGRLGKLEGTHRIVLVDPLGFGDSPKPWARYTIDRHVEALYETLKGERSFILVGHSMGTLLSIGYAARHPEQVERLVLFSVPYFDGAEEARRFFRKGPIPYRWFLSNLALAVIICVLTRRVFAWLVPYLEPDLPREVAADIVKHSWRSFTSSFWEIICNYAVARDANGLDGQLPVLCLHGDRDPIAPMSSVLALARGRPNWRVQVLPGVDHHPLLRASGACHRAIVSGPPQEHHQIEKCRISAGVLKTTIAQFELDSV